MNRPTEDLALDPLGSSSERPHTVPKLFLGEGAREAAESLVEDLLGACQDHPDLFRIAPEGAGIGIDRVREAVFWARYPPVQGQWRVVLLGPAERLSHEAASALLKSLEEAPPYLVFVLYAQAPDQLIPTVRSRCAVVWTGDGEARWAHALAEAGYSPEEIRFLLPLISCREDLLACTAARREPQQEWEEARREAEEFDLEELAARCVAYRGDPIRRRAMAFALAQGLASAPADRILAAAEALAQGGKEAVLAFLRELVSYLLRDDCPYPPELRRAWAKKASLARGELEANVNAKLLVEVILLWPKKS
ncbi:hypothetical protein LR090_02420 [Candidatus Bipolaricaulota bacterium]|nr:hypothetical protein [Candidatus Bipolaricaulota bacterium]